MLGNTPSRQVSKQARRTCCLLHSDRHRLAPKVPDRRMRLEVAVSLQLRQESIASMMIRSRCSDRFSPNRRSAWGRVLHVPRFPAVALDEIPVPLTSQPLPCSHCPAHGAWIRSPISPIQTWRTPGRGQAIKAMSYYPEHCSSANSEDEILPLELPECNSAALPHPAIRNLPPRFRVTRPKSGSNIERLEGMYGHGGDGVKFSALPSSRWCWVRLERIDERGV